MALSLELLDWNLRTFGKKKYVPILVSHFESRARTLAQWRNGTRCNGYVGLIHRTVVEWDKLKMEV